MELASLLQSLNVYSDEPVTPLRHQIPLRFDTTLRIEPGAEKSLEKIIQVSGEVRELLQIFSMYIGVLGEVF